MITLFDPKNLSKSSSNYNLDKLLWLNAHYIKNTPNAELAELLHPFGVDIREHDKLELLLDATKERGKTLVELSEQIKMILHVPRGSKRDPLRVCRTASKLGEGTASSM